MRVFYFLLVILTLFTFISELKRKEKKISIITTIVLIFLLTLVSGTRTSFVDTGAYINLYKQIDSVKIINDVYEPGFIIILKELYKISTNPQFMIIITAFITNALIILTLRRYSSNISKSLMIFMYITSGTYISTMNGLRQYLAAAIIFYFSFLIEKKKFIKYFSICLVVSSIHSSVLIMIPIYFMINTEIWSKKIFILIGTFIITMIFFNPIINYLFEVIGGKFGGYKDFNEGGANIIRIMAISVPTVLAFITRKEFDKKKINERLFVNMSLINLFIMIVSLNNWIFARFAIYVGLYNLILLPYILENNFLKKEKRLIKYIFIICYLIFFWYEAKISGIKYIGLLI